MPLPRKNDVDPCGRCGKVAWIRYPKPGRSFPNRTCKQCRSERQKRSFRFAKYGLTFAQYERAKELRLNKCDICKCVTELVVDHAHGKCSPRGLLCRTCNMGLGLFRDSPGLLAQATIYLENNGTYL